MARSHVVGEGGANDQFKIAVAVNILHDLVYVVVYVSDGVHIIPLKT